MLSVAGTMLGVAGAAFGIAAMALRVAGMALGVAGRVLGVAGRTFADGGAAPALAITMNQSQDNLTTMFETTDATLQEHNALWSAMPAFADAVDRLEEGIEAIRGKQSGQAATGDTEAKQAARDAVEEQTLVIGSQLSALSAKNNDAILAAQVNYDKSTLDKAALSELMVAANSVKGAAAANAAVLASDYGITAADLTAFAAAITHLDEMKGAPRQAVVNRRVATLSLPDAIGYVRGILRNEIDKMMEKFKKAQPDFYAAYFAARVIVDRTGTHAAPAPAAVPA